MQMTWSENYSVHVKLIDEQHKNLFRILNELTDILGTEKLSERLPILLDELNEYAKYHFDTEEKYFKEFNFDESDDHINQHRYYIKKIKELTTDPNLLKKSFDLVDFLEDWWINHINLSDKKYSDCFNKNGLK